MLTRAVAMRRSSWLAIASILVYAVAALAWDVAWLRVSLLRLCFSGFFPHADNGRAPDSARAARLFSLFDLRLWFGTVRFPNDLFDQLGWVWAMFGLLFVATFLTQWLFGAPTALEVFRAQMRRARGRGTTCLRMAFGRVPADIGFSGEEHPDATAGSSCWVLPRFCVRMKPPDARLFCRERSA